MNFFKIKRMIDSTLKNANILIVDDQEANIAVLTGFLQMQGYTNIYPTIDPRLVADLIFSFKPDLILLDLSMPFMTGFELLKQIKSLISAELFLPILVLTADISFESKKKALTDGAHDFLTKPFDLVEVGLRIRNLLFTSHLQQQLHGQNQELEEKVKERTSKLEKINSELLIAKDKASASDNLKTAFMQNISHEIRTPLNGVIGFGALLTEKEATFEEREKYLELLRSSSSRLINTITDYMDISLIVSNNMEINKSLVDIIPLLDEIKTHFQAQCNNKHLDLNVEIPK
jgi:two-component system, sensor histidine kinase and response regulator